MIMKNSLLDKASHAEKISFKKKDPISTCEESEMSPKKRLLAKETEPFLNDTDLSLSFFSSKTNNCSLDENTHLSQLGPKKVRFLENPQIILFQSLKRKKQKNIFDVECCCKIF